MMVLTQTSTHFVNNLYESGYKLMKYRGSSGDNKARIRACWCISGDSFQSD
ncbi:hypothetical protein [Vibrio gallaecicus]|uniref:hypothetical protein n=1 Tax=Vibrio gallaecicus TaxID=552386 RepID=UPI0025B2A9CD|nr:hypothetical protein [Vibrio gallaecicus]MDN3616082.1 hypothetical protein [Vibrio gallaecicus]